MNKLFWLFFLAMALLAPNLAQAANCFWVGGSATWDGTNTGGGGSGGIKWASTSGGGTACAGAGTGGSPSGSGDTATFDASSGGGTVTVAANRDGTTIQAITAGAFTGTIDWDTNGPIGMTFTSTAGMALSGSGSRKFLMDTATFTFTGNGGTPFDISTTTNLDPTSNLTANFVYTATTTSSRTFGGGGRTFGSLTVSANTSRGIFIISGANTFSDISLPAGVYAQFPAATTTITNAPTWAGTSSSPIAIQTVNPNSGAATISVASGTVSCDWCSIFFITGTGGATFSSTNSFDLGRNTTISITPPSGGAGGGRIIGG